MRRARRTVRGSSGWNQQFLEGGHTALAVGGKLSSQIPRERAMAEEIEELKAALGEAHVQLRVWKKSAEHRLGPSRTSR